MKVSDKVIVVTCERGDTATQTMLSKYYPISSNRIKTEFRLSPHLLPEILHDFNKDIDILPESVQNLYWKELQRRDITSDLLKNGPRHSGFVSDRLTLRTHQQLGFELAEVNDRFAFFYDTRTGKTPLALSIINEDVQKNPKHKWLVICPLILVYNAWLEDSQKFFPNLVTINCHAATPSKRIEAINTSGNLYLTNTESFVRYQEYFKDFTGCFVDESSDLKSASSKVSKAIVDFSQTLQRFYLLAGTPAPNGEWEYYMQMKTIDYYGWHQSYTQFKQYYFLNMSYSPQYEKLVLNPTKRDELLNNIKKHALYIDKEDVLDTPGREFIKVEYDMPVELAKHYSEVKNKLFTTYKDSTITVSSAGAKLNKLNQVSSGFIIDTKAIHDNQVFDTTKAEWYLLDSTRFQKLQELLQNCNDNQVLIWANYKKEFEIIKQMLKDKCACVYGDTSLAEKNEAIKSFKEGKVQYLVANPASADKGLTLTNAHIAIYFSLNWSYELFKQSYDRIYGGKDIQPNFCTYYILIAKGTIDSILYDSVLQGKGDASYAILNHLKHD